MRQLRLTEAQLNAITRKAKVPAAPKNKYRAIKTIVDGIEFDSRKEAKRWQELKLLESTGKIAYLNRQVRYEVTHGIHHICEYVADFVYHSGEDNHWTIIVEDCKGYRKGAAYANFRIKAKLMKACYGVEVTEV